MFSLFPDPLEEVGDEEEEETRRRSEKLTTGVDNAKHDDEGFAELQVLEHNGNSFDEKKKSVTRISLKKMLKNRGDVDNV